MVGMLLGLGLSLGSGVEPSPKSVDAGPEVLLQAEIIARGEKTNEGTLVKAASLPWLEIAKNVSKNPDFLFQFAANPRKFEEFIAGCYERAGFEVVLTPQRGDLGRDVIATRRGFGSIRFLEQTKAYSPGHLVTHDDVRAMLGVLSIDPLASKGLITTTSDFQPGIWKDQSEFSRFMPHRLELKNGQATAEWIREIMGDNN